jgi:hypothetical protein
MMKSRSVTGGVLALILCGSAAVSAQSLGALARQEEERRKAVKTPGKVYTNGTLKSEPAPSTPPTATPGTPQAPAADAANPTADAAAAPDPNRTEKYWRDRVNQARETLDRAKTFADALQSRINALTADFANRADPAQRAVIGSDRDKALAELDRVNKEIQTGTKAIAGVQDEARKAGVPAGWVR